MKYTKPIKFKRALKELISYIDYCNGLGDPGMWREEIDQLKLQIDPKDWNNFEKSAEQLEVMGLIVAEAYEYIESTLDDFEKLSDKLLKGVKK